MKSLIYNVSLSIYFVNLRINGTANHFHREDMLIICVLQGFFFINIFFQMAFVINFSSAHCTFAPPFDDRKPSQQENSEAFLQWN